MAARGSQPGKRMWPSLHTADVVFSLSNIALIVGLALTVVATIGAVWMANVREGYLKRELAESNERIALAQEAAAKANEAAERERLARVKIEEKLAPDSLPKSSS